MTCHASLSLAALSASITCSTFSHFISPSNIFLCFPQLRFHRVIAGVTRCSSFSHLITWQKRLPDVYVFYFWVIFLCQHLVTLFSLISLQSMRFVAFSIRTTFLFPLVSFVTVLKLSRPRIHTSEWVQCVYLIVSISFSGYSFMLVLFLMQFQCCCNHHFILKYRYPSFWTDPWTFIVSTFCYSIPTLFFFLLSSSKLSNSCCKSSLFSAINTVSSACLKLFTLRCASCFNSWVSF